MARELPFPLDVQLPDGWRAVDPDRAAVPGVAFVALGPGADGSFTATITVGGDFQPDDVPTTQLAEDSVERMRAIDPDVEVADRREFGSESLPSLAQTLYLTTVLDGQPHHLVQSQVYLAVRHPGADQRAVFELALTATEYQITDAGPEFEEFVRSLRPTVRELDAETLQAAASGPGAPEELRGLADAVREGRTTWAAIADGQARDLPEMQDVRDAISDEADRLVAEWRNRARR